MAKEKYYTDKYGIKYTIRPSDGRYIAYDRENKCMVSYPRLLLKTALGLDIKADEDVHHIDGDYSNNDLSNLQVLKHGEHQRSHSQKYFDKEMICPICNKKFIWTAKSQRIANQNDSRETDNHINRLKKISQPCCSKSCCGKYGRQLQLENKTANYKKANEKFMQPVNLYDKNDNFIKLFSNVNECKDYLLTIFTDKAANAVYTGITNVLNGKRKSYLGYKFKTEK